MYLVVSIANAGARFFIYFLLKPSSFQFSLLGFFFLSANPSSINQVFVNLFFFNVLS